MLSQITNPLTLTEVETLGLSSEVNLADGHAYQDMDPEFQSIIRNLPGLWSKAVKYSIPALERRYIDTFGRLIATSALREYPHFNICPSASNSIDTVAAWLRSRSMKTGLLEPTFDNLALILKRREVELYSITESMLHDLEALVHHVAIHKIEALFLVNPNNPTGTSLSANEFERLARWCATNKIVLIVDQTFRFYSPAAMDDYAIMMESGVTFLSIEDTGKTYPTLDLKASALVYSPDISEEIRTIYQEIYLSISAFTLVVMTELFERTIQIGWDGVLRGLVRQRRKRLREVLKNSPLFIPPGSVESTLSVEWIDNLEHRLF